MKLSEVLSDLAERVAEGLRPNTVQKIIDDETAIFGQGTQITVKNKIPDTAQIPIENPAYWLKIPDVIACFVDMEGSTMLEKPEGFWTIQVLHEVRLGQLHDPPYF
jgi:hypothetical protein